MPLSHYICSAETLIVCEQAEQILGMSAVELVTLKEDIGMRMRSAESNHTINQEAQSLKASVRVSRRSRFWG